MKKTLFNMLSVRGFAARKANDKDGGALIALSGILRLSNKAVEDGDLQKIKTFDAEARDLCLQAADAILDFASTVKLLSGGSTQAKAKASAPVGKVLSRAQFSALKTPLAKAEFFRKGGRLTD